MNYPYVYRIANAFGMPSLPGRKGQRCRVLARAMFGKNARMIEFEDGLLACVSGNAIRKAPV